MADSPAPEPKDGARKAANAPPQAGREAPSLADVRQYPVTAVIALAAIGVTFASWSDGWALGPFLLDSRAWQGQFWRIPASALPHGDLLHLAFNLYWLWFLGTATEQHFGGRRYFGIVLLLAAGSALAQAAVSNPGIGLSGVGYGLCSLLFVLGRLERRFAGIVTPRTALRINSSRTTLNFENGSWPCRKRIDSLGARHAMQT